MWPQWSLVADLFPRAVSPRHVGTLGETLGCQLFFEFADSIVELGEFTSISEFPPSSVLRLGPLSLVRTIIWTKSGSVDPLQACFTHLWPLQAFEFVTPSWAGGG